MGILAAIGKFLLIIFIYAAGVVLAGLGGWWLFGQMFTGGSVWQWGGAAFTAAIGAALMIWAKSKF